MKHLRFLLLFVAAAALAVLLAKLDRAAVWSYILRVGWGMVFLQAQEIVPQLINATAWRCAYRKKDQDVPSFWHLLRLRIIGDGVNYLTPSATIGGEFARLEALDGPVPTEKNSSAIGVTKLAQSLGHALFITLGLLTILTTGDRFFPVYGPWLRRAFVFFVGLLTSFAIAAYAIYHSRFRGRITSIAVPDVVSWRSIVGNLPRQCLSFMAEHPCRFVAAVSLFISSYAWTSVESYWTCRFLGIPITMATALVIEVLSNLIDGLTFMIPAKMGTQEGGKTAIFAALGMNASAGFAFGVIRHLRELAWSAAGFLAYALQRGSKSAVANLDPKPPSCFETAQLVY